jgi:parallel beta-helix repeat protein
MLERSAPPRTPTRPWRRIGLLAALLAVLAIPTAPSQAAAATRIADHCTHVAKSGANVQALVDRVKTGSKICLKTGSYRPFTIRRSYIAVISYAGHTATISGNTSSFAAGVRIDGATGVLIKRLRIQGNSIGIFLNNARKARIYKNVVTDNAYGIEVHGTTTGTVIDKNLIKGNDRYLDAARSAGGMNLYKVSGGLTIRKNRIYDNDEVAIEVYGARQVTITGNRLRGSHDLIETGTDSGVPCDRLKITKNTFYAVSVAAGAEERGIYLRCATNTVISHNTFRNLDRFAIGLYASGGQFSGPLHHVSIHHNRISGGRAFTIDSALPSSVKIDYDRIGRCTSSTCPLEGKMLAGVSGKGNTTSIAQLRAWTGYEKHGKQTK